VGRHEDGLVQQNYVALLDTMAFCFVCNPQPIDEADLHLERFSSEYAFDVVMTMRLLLRAGSTMPIVDHLPVQTSVVGYSASMLALLLIRL